MAIRVDRSSSGGGQLTLASRQGRWTVLGCVLGSGIAGIDATVVNIALPAIGRDLNVGFSALQWTVTAYTVTLASLILLGGALGDRFGRRRIFVVGLVWFAVASLLCALAPGPAVLIAARALQGVGGALLTPASLAMIQASFVDTDRARAIGAWSALSGTASALAPFVGGWLLQTASWRWVFLINPPIVVGVIVIAVRHMPETSDDEASRRLDPLGSFLGVAGLAGVTTGIIAASDHGFGSLSVEAPLVAGLVALGCFVWAEHHQANALLPLTLFSSRQFSVTNLVTLLLYAANGGALLLLVVELQVVSGFSPLRSGAALLPITVVMLLFAARFGAWGQRFGPRLLMAAGPVVSAGGLLLFTRLSAHSSYVTSVLPAVTVFGFGLAIFVAPLTATVLGAVPASHAGIASGVNNAVARAGSLLAVAALPVIVGLTGHAYDKAGAFLGPFRTAMWICVGLHLGGGALAAVLVRNERHAESTPARNVTGSRSVTLAGEPCPPCMCSGRADPVRPQASRTAPGR